jgi:hypothetical protein
MSHPAAAATADGLYLLVYRRESDRVRVMVYRSTDQGVKWEEHCSLGTRGLVGGKGGATSPGDYLGLVAGKGSLYAAYVLAGEEREHHNPRLYVAECRAVTPKVKSR